MQRRIELGVALLILAPFVAASAGPAKHSGAAKEPTSDAWEIPDVASARRNPLTPSGEALQTGRTLFMIHCQSCHGTEGRGDGPDARLHERRKGHAPRNLTDSDLQQNLTDGDIFYRISRGIIERDKDNVVMPAFEDRVPSDAERWQIVLFVRELGRNGRSGALR
jgi:mono/diheme cytochrome c family protein